MLKLVHYPSNWLHLNGSLGMSPIQDRQWKRVRSLILHSFQLVSLRRTTSGHWHHHVASLTSEQLFVLDAVAHIKVGVEGSIDIPVLGTIALNQ